jgi:hypothetical protein
VVKPITWTSITSCMYIQDKYPLNFRSKPALNSRLWTHQLFTSYLSCCVVCVFTRVVRLESIPQRQPWPEIKWTPDTCLVLYCQNSVTHVRSCSICHKHTPNQKFRKSARSLTSTTFFRKLQNCQKNKPCSTIWRFCKLSIVNLRRTFPT